MRRKLPFRAWFYFRMGWATYVAFVFAAINTLVTTYYLAIKDVPTLKIIFPSFGAYLGITTMIGVPLLIGIGYFHFKKSHAYSSEMDVATESNPYYYKLPPGYTIEVMFPLYRALTNLLIKMANNQKLTETELNELNELQNKIDVLTKGGHVGNPKRKPS